MSEKFAKSVMSSTVNNITTKPICLLNVGHTRKNQGAKNELYRMSEFRFNSFIADLVKRKVSNCVVEIINQNDDEGLHDLAQRINKKTFDFCISLHCNAFDKNSTGTETLYYTGREKCKEMADVMQLHLTTALGLKNRGVIEIIEKERGWVLLKEVDKPIILCEPFFIDNDDDYEKVMGENGIAFETFINTYAQVIDLIAENFMEK